MVEWFRDWDFQTVMMIPDVGSGGGGGGCIRGFVYMIVNGVFCWETRKAFSQIYSVIIQIINILSSLL